MASILRHAVHGVLPLVKVSLHEFEDFVHGRFDFGIIGAVQIKEVLPFGMGNE